MNEVKVIVLKDSFDAVEKNLRKETLRRAAEAGGIVIRDNAVLNIRRTFKKVHGAREGLSQIGIKLDKSTQDSAYYDIGPSVVYGRIHELGGTIYPIRGKFLSWINEEGKRIFARMVKIPKRPYLKPAVESNIEEIKTAVGNAIKKGIMDSL